MDGTGFSVAVAALAVAVMFSRRKGGKVFSPVRDDGVAGLAAELRRLNDLTEERVNDLEARLRRLEDAERKERS